MSTATKSQPKFNHDESQRRVRHPLRIVRRIISCYIIVEGVALTLLCAILLFWFGLAADFGLYHFDFGYFHGVDWILEFNEIDPTGLSSFGCRVIVLAAIVVGLLALGFTKVVLRWFRDFNDRAIALVLERRFHKELGDRLITAIELADPKLAKKHGHSQAMVEQTILEAVAILKKLPVASVFNWRRLVGLWFMVGASSLGTLVALMVIFCASTAVFADKWMNPWEFTWRFYDVAAIWTERDVLMTDTYWPRRSHIEIGGFQPSRDNPDDMRVAKDDKRPELRVRAFEWVIAEPDRKKAPYGWRPLMWSDLAPFEERGYIAKGTLAAVEIPKKFPHWQLELDELEPDLVAALFESDVQIISSGDMQAHLKKPAVNAKVVARGAEGKLDSWMNWKEWSVDKLGLQKENVYLRDPELVHATFGASTAALMGSLAGQGPMPLGHGPILAGAGYLFPGRTDYTIKPGPLQALFAEIDKLAEYPMLSRTIRKVTIPKSVEVNFRGEASGSNATYQRQDGNKYNVSLESLKESNRFKFRARGENYFTPVKSITLVAAPTPASITTDTEEPAYIYHRLLGVDQMALRGVKHVIKDRAHATQGESNDFRVASGSKLAINVFIDNTPLVWGGIALNKVRPTRAEELKLPGDRGLVITSIEADSVAPKAGLEVGDVIVKINDQYVPNDLPALAEFVAGMELKDLLTHRDERDRIHTDRYHKVFAYKMAKGRTYQIDMKSKLVDSYVRLEDPTGRTVVEDDNSGGSRNARITHEAEETGVYKIIATTAVNDVTGQFTLSVKKIKGDESIAFTVLRKVQAAAGRPQAAQQNAAGEEVATNAVEIPAAVKYKPRRLRADRPVFVTSPPQVDPNYDPFPGKIVVNDDRYGFSLLTENITRNHEFIVEFYDEDNIRGKHRFKIERVLDADPLVGNLSVRDYLPRRPKFRSTAPQPKKDGEKDKGVDQPRDYSEFTNAYLITPDALVPFDCKVQDDYGLVRVGYHYKYRKVDFELVSYGGAKKLPALEIDKEARNFRVGMALGNLQFWPGNPISWNAAPNYLAWSSATVKRDLDLAQNYKEGLIPSAGFDEMLKREAPDMIRPEALKNPDIARKLLTGDRSSRAWDFDFKQDRGFDVQLHLKGLKANPLDDIGQMHYLLQIAVQATDNNVETGAAYYQVEDGKIVELRGNTRKNGNGYVNFIVVSENELLAQIALEEETIREKLEVAKEKVDGGMVSLIDQMSKTQKPDAEMEGILNRMNEIRTGLVLAGNILSDAQQAYENILKEMDVNRIKSEKIKTIQGNIIGRLDFIVMQPDPKFPTAGSLVRAQEALQKAHALVEEETNAKKQPDKDAHRANMLEANRHMDILSKDIQRVLDAMSEGIVESKLIAMIATIEAEQRKHSRYLHQIWLKQQEDIAEELLKGLKKSPEGETPKKSSRLQPRPDAVQLLAAAERAHEGRIDSLLREQFPTFEADRLAEMRRRVLTATRRK